MEKHAAAIVPDVVAGLVHEDEFGAGDSDTESIEREPREAIVISAVVDCRGTHGRTSYDRAGDNPGVVNVHVMVRHKPRVENEIEKARIIPALALIAEVEDECLGGDIRSVHE